MSYYINLRQIFNRSVRKFAMKKQNIRYISRKPRCTKYTAQQIKAVQKLYKENRLTLVKISAKTGMTVPSIVNYTRGLKRVPRSLKNKSVKKWTRLSPVQINNMVNLYRADVTAMALSKRYKVSVATVNRYVKMYHALKRTKKVKSLSPWALFAKLRFAK